MQEVAFLKKQVKSAGVRVGRETSEGVCQRKAEREESCSAGI